MTFFSPLCTYERLARMSGMIGSTTDLRRRRRRARSAVTIASISSTQRSSSSLIDHVVVFVDRRDLGPAVASRRSMAASGSWLRPRSREPSTSNDGGSTKIADRLGQPPPHLPGALHVDHEHQVEPAASVGLGFGAGRCRTVAEDVGPLQEVVVARPCPRRRPAHKIIVDPVRFAGPGGPGRVRPRPPQSGHTSTSRSTTVVLPVPDGAETTNSRPRRAAALLDILHLLADALELGLGGDDESRWLRRSSTLDPIVLISRFIS